MKVFSRYLQNYETTIILIKCHKAYLYELHWILHIYPIENILQILIEISYSDIS